MKCAQNCTKSPAVLRDNKQPADALAHLKRAMQLDCQAGVKKDIERLERELKPKPATVVKAPVSAPRAVKPRHRLNVADQKDRRLTECAPRRGGTPVDEGVTRPETGVHRPPIQR